MKRIIFLLMIGGWFHSSLDAQDLNVDLLKIIEIYSSADELYFETKVDLFNRRNPEKSAYQTGSTYFRSGEHLFLEFDGMKRIFNQEGVLVINEQNKLISFFSAYSEGNDDVDFSALNMMEEMQRLTEQLDSIEYEPLPGGKKRYQLFPKAGEFDKIEIYISDFPFLDKVIYHYNPEVYPENHHVVINYKVLQNQKKYSKDYFSLNRYLHVEGDKLTLSKAFENYELTVYEN